MNPILQKTAGETASDCIIALERAGYTFESQTWNDRHRCHMYGFIVPERMANGGYQRITVNLDDLKEEAKLYE